MVVTELWWNFRFTSEEVTGQNQVKASVQRRIRQNIADEVSSWDSLSLSILLDASVHLSQCECRKVGNLIWFEGVSGCAGPVSRFGAAAG